MSFDRTQHNSPKRKLHPHGPTPDTVIIGAGQAGLTTSYWLTPFGVEHQLLERRDSLCGAFQDRWDSFYVNTLNLALDLPARRTTATR